MVKAGREQMVWDFLAFKDVCRCMRTYFLRETCGKRLRFGS